MKNPEILVAIFIVVVVLIAIFLGQPKKKRSAPLAQSFHSIVTDPSRSLPAFSN